ncbi:MAG TPA: hypothetical protein DDY52_02630 [Candidatus Moranbacteria bacterium]|nr:MAG: hypothetical protein UR51_C0019G0025 [Candidatus Moranbacteria bacterium GW2011_GWF1_34_10]HBI17024.1 hypothetical protein [Candidatus Moranbacteria bacterium]
MERKADIRGRIELNGIKVRALFKELIRLYVSGEVREEDIAERFSSELKPIIKDFRHLRDKTGQIRLEGEMFLHQLDRFRRDLSGLEFNKFVELCWMKMDEDSIKFKVCVIVLSAGAHYFRASLDDGLLHAEGWDEFLTIME